MAQLTLTVPETLQQALDIRAREEGVSLDQYVIYSLTRQLSSNSTFRIIPRHDVEEQRERFDAWRESLIDHLDKPPTIEDARRILDEQSTYA